MTDRPDRERKISPAGAFALAAKDKAVHAVSRHPVTTAVIAAVLSGLLSAAGASVIYTSVAQSEDKHRDHAITKNASDVEHVRLDVATQGVQVYRLQERVEATEERQERLQAETFERLGQIDKCLREACWRGHRGP